MKMFTTMTTQQLLVNNWHSCCKKIARRIQLVNKLYFICCSRGSNYIYEISIVMLLLPCRNINGDTPFMTAVRCRNYPTAIKLLKISLLLTSLNPSTSLLSMLHPEGSHADDNPLFVLCHNEPCSYTWTGRDHIMQDVYECYNCGLTGSLCCCTECAFTCHRGHNCG